jgi:hypothetical protein
MALCWTALQRGLGAGPAASVTMNALYSSVIFRQLAVTVPTMSAAEPL